jgi:hypothetical protein
MTWNPATRSDGRRSSMVLVSPAFVVAVAVLVINDWVLKDAVGSWWTGKLSDVAGLFAFPLFWSAFLPRHARSVYIATAIGFLVWKSPLVDPLLAGWNSIGLWPAGRVVDYTDWIALGVLWPSYRVAHSTAPSTWQGWSTMARRVAATAMTGLAAIAFLATSVAEPNPAYDLPMGSDYRVNGARAALKAYFLAHEWYLQNNPNRTSLRDSLYEITEVNDTLLEVHVVLRDTLPCGTMVALTRVATQRKAPNLVAIRDSLVQVVIQPLQTRFPTCP